MSTGGTLIEAINICENHGSKEIYAGAMHGIFAGDSIERLDKSCVKEVVVTNTVPIDDNKKIDKIKVISIEPLFAEAIRRINEGQPLGDLILYEK